MQNLLPQDGIAYYYDAFISDKDADLYFNALFKDIMWEHDRLVMFGKHITTKRKVAWYGDQPFAYRYSHQTKYAAPWLPILRDIKNLVEIKTKSSFNSCLLNLYHNGLEGMGWHSDDEKELKPQGDIASISFGAPRKFVFRHKVTKETIPLMLNHGSLLMMIAETQSYWQHSLPKTKRVGTPRINLTFRSIL